MGFHAIILYREAGYFWSGQNGGCNVVISLLIRASALEMIVEKYSCYMCCFCVYCVFSVSHTQVRYRKVGKLEKCLLFG